MSAPANVLFLCTGNSARSIMSEALMTALGAPRFRGFSAGSQPSGRVHPLAEALLKEEGIWREEFSSKSWDVFARANAPRMDVIITVCDNAAGEVCPIWPGHPTTAHWGFEDPAAFDGPEDEHRALFRKIYGQIRSKIELFLMIPFERLDEFSIRAQLRAIGDLDPESL